MFTAQRIAFLAVILAQLLGGIRCGVYDNTENWVQFDKTKNFPDNAVWGGFMPSGYDNYVGRAMLTISAGVTSVLPARVVAETGSATYNSDTKGYTATSFQLLVSNETLSYDWVRSYDGFMEKNAVSVGTSSTNERVYVCRARTVNAIYIGSLLPSRGACVIPFETLTVHQVDKYEVLVRRQRPVHDTSLAEL